MSIEKILYQAREAESLVQKAHVVCPYSNATRGNIDVRLIVVESQP